MAQPFPQEYCWDSSGTLTTSHQPPTTTHHPPPTTHHPPRLCRFDATFKIDDIAGYDHHTSKSHPNACRIDSLLLLKDPKVPKGRSYGGPFVLDSNELCQEDFVDTVTRPWSLRAICTSRTVDSLTEGEQERLRLHLNSLPSNEYGTECPKTYIFDPRACGHMRVIMADTGSIVFECFAGDQSIDSKPDPTVARAASTRIFLHSVFVEVEHRNTYQVCHPAKVSVTRRRLSHLLLNVCAAWASIANADRRDAGRGV